jgi:hypothetical protein
MSRPVCTGAARPPRFLLLLQRMVCAGLLLGVAVAQAQSIEGCRYINSGPIGAEGFDGPDTFGLRLSIRDSRWGWGAAHGGAIAGCPSCAPPSIAKGIMRIGLAPFYPPSDDYQLRAETGQQEANPVEFALHPRAIAVGMRAMTNFTPHAIAPESDISPVTLFGMPGLARAIRVESTGNPVYGLALAMQDRCFALFGMFFREDNAPLSITALQQIDDALQLDRYQPRFNLEQLTPRPPPKPWIDFPLGDARKQREEAEKIR